MTVSNTFFKLSPDLRKGAKASLKHHKLILRNKSLKLIIEFPAVVASVLSVPLRFRGNSALIWRQSGTLPLTLSQRLFADWRSWCAFSDVFACSCLQWFIGVTGCLVRIGLSLGCLTSQWL